MIRANYAQQNRNCVREWGIGFTNPLRQFKDVLFNNFYTPDTVQDNRDKSGFNHGYNTSYSWNMPLKSGGMGATGEVRGSGALVASALAVKLAEADLTGTGDLDAIGGLVVQLLADLVGSGEISDADLKAFLQAVASLTGSGAASGTRTGIGALISALTGDGTAETSVATGTGELDADLVVTGTGLTTGNVGAAVWAALAAANNVVGTMGEKLNDAGSAGNPWSALLAANNDPNTFGELVQAMNTLVDELHKIQGLNISAPMTVTPSSRVAGDVSLTLTGDGVTTTTVTRD